MPNNQCETFEFIYKLCTSNVHWLSFEPFLRVMTGSSQSMFVPFWIFRRNTPRKHNIGSFEWVVHHKPTCAELRIQVASFEQKYPACTTFFPFQKLCIKGKHWCNFVPYFEILHHNPTCAYVRTFWLGCAPYAPRAQLRTIFRSCTCRTTNVKLLNFFTSCVPQM